MARSIAWDGKVSRQTPFWICNECGNTLNPREDVATQKLMRHCSRCDTVTDDADSNLVYVNELRPSQSQLEAGADIVKDTTLPRAIGQPCGSCGHTEAVFFQAPMKRDSGMTLVFMCTNCGHRWEVGK